MLRTRQISPRPPFRGIINSLREKFILTVVLRGWLTMYSTRFFNLQLRVHRGPTARGWTAFYAG